MGVIVSKYGGSSITTADDIERIKKITADDGRRQVIVVSAPGKRHDADTKVTDMLIALAQSKDDSLIGKISERFQMLSPGRSCADLEQELSRRLSSTLSQPAYADSLKAFGEEACAKVVAEALHAQYIDPKLLFVVTPEFGNAKIITLSETMIRASIPECTLCVVPGFYGYTPDGQIATLSRGGSDLTGAYLASSLDAIVYENFTDRSGILAAGPDLVDNPKKIREITYREIRDLAYLGFKVFHPEAMGPVERRLIPVHVRRTTGYPEEGTYIVHDRLSDPARPVVGVGYQNGYCSFSLERFGLNEERHILGQLLRVFQAEEIDVEFFNNAIDDITFIVREDQCRAAVSRVAKKLYHVVGDDAMVSFQEQLGCLVVAGKGLRGRRGISADIQLTLAQAGVNIKFISQGSQERSIIYGIANDDGRKAVNAVYDTYIR